MCNRKHKRDVGRLWWLMLPVVAALVFALLQVAESAQERVLLLKVVQGDPAWSDASVEKQLHQILSRNQRLRVLPARPIYDDQPPFPEDLYNADSLMHWGLEIGGRYLMVVVVDKTRLERRKSFSLPLIMHMYQTYGVISGELRLMDLIRGRMLASEPFEVKIKGSRVLQQTFDDDRGDPSLHMTAMQKTQLFEELQQKASLLLVERLQELTGV